MDTLGETDASIYSCKLTYTFNTTKIKYECYFQRVTSPAMHQKDNKALYPSRFNKRQRMLSDADNLNSSDSARLHRTISLMYVGARHLEFGITFHKVT